VTTLGAAVLTVGGNVRNVGLDVVAIFDVTGVVDGVIQVDGILDLCVNSFCCLYFCSSSNQFSKFFVYSPVGSYRSASARYIGGC
jgi:hypothetical protein